MRYPIFLCALFWILLTIIWITSVNAYEFPPYEELKLKITGDISEDYSNNINFTNDEKQEDFRTMLTLGLDLKYEGKRRSIGFSGNARRRIEYDSSDISNSSEKATLFFNNDFSAYDRIRISGTFSHTQEPDTYKGVNVEACRQYYEDLGLTADEIDIECNKFEEEFGRFRGRFDSYNNALNFVYNKSISEHFAISPNYSYSQHWSPEEGTQDSHQNAAGAVINYSYSPATGFSLSYKYRISEFEDGDKITHQSVRAGIKQYITRRIYIAGSIGGEFVSENNDNISGSGSVTAEIDERSIGRISYTRGVRISPNEEDTFRNWRLSASLTKLLIEDLDSSLTVFYGKGDFDSADITDTLMGASIILSYNFWTGKRGSRVYGELGYTYSDLDSTSEDRSYTRGSAVATLALAF